jgi:hypothetical protein
MEVEGTRVFVKRVPLTDLELQPQHVRSTANMFDLPLFYQYGAGSAGFGAWRELAAHIMTTGWVLQNDYDGFPLLYHWRVLPDSAPAGFVDGLGGVEGAVAHWEGSSAVRRRLEAIGRSSHSLVLFLEHVPHTLAEWLGDNRDAAPPEPGDESPYRRAEQALLRGTEFMSARGLIHFDAHFLNLLTDGEHVYFSDFGLALSTDFELSPEEREFFERHRDHDRAHVAGHLVLHHVADSVRGSAERDRFVRDWAEGTRPQAVPASVAALLTRHARTTTVLYDFRRRLRDESKRTPYPAAELADCLNGA